MRQRVPPVLLLLFVVATSACDEAVAPAERPANLPLAAAVIGGDDYACALLTSGSVQCTGQLQASSGGPTGLISINGGEQHACGLSGNRGILCWGINTHGRLLVPGGTDFLAVAPGTLHSCAIRGSGEIVCWGHDDAGQTEPPRGTGFRAIAASRGGQHSCALRADGSITCWGPDGGTPPADTGFIAIALTQHGGCAQDRSRTLQCWGPEGLGTIEGSGVTSFSVGRDFVCLTRNGHIECTGAAGSVIGAPPAGDDFIQVGAGYHHACALHARGTIACWGSMTIFPGVAQD